MSSSERVLLAVAGHDATPTLLRAPDRHLDDSTRALLEQERTRGYAEGHAAGRAEVQAAAATLAGAVTTALGGLTSALHGQHAALATALEGRVLAGCRAVLGEEPVEGRRVAAAAAAAVARAESPTVEVRVPGGLLDLVRAALADTAGATVVADPAMAGEDLRVVAPDLDVDLRRERLLVALDEVLTTTPDLGPLDAGDGPGDAGVGRA